MSQTFDRYLADPIPDDDSEGRLSDPNRSQGSQGDGNRKLGKITASTLWNVRRFRSISRVWGGELNGSGTVMMRLRTRI